MSDLISRQGAIDFFLKKGMITSAIYVERMPSAQPERKTGEWIRKKELVPLPWDCSPLLNDDYDADTHSVWQEYYHCSNCDWKSGEFKGGNFCTNCGADMRGEQNE